MSFHKKKKAPHDEEAWLMTYADFITLLMSFFVLIISVSEPKTSKFEQVREGLMSSFTQTTISTPFRDISQQLLMIIEQSGLERQISVEETNRGVTLEFASAYLFDSGSATFRSEAGPILEQVATAILDFEGEEYIVQVEGHTDDVPIETPQFPSNWELSAMRASGIVHYLVEKGVESLRMRAVGFADARPKVPNKDEYGNPILENRDQNRRITVRIERLMEE